MTNKSILSLGLVFATWFMKAQDVVISGIVSDVNGKPIVGAIIIERGTNNAVKSDLNGSYQLMVPSNRTPTSVLIRLVGFGSAEVAIDGSSDKVNFSPSLGAQSRNLNEVVVSASKKSEKILNAPASVSVISEARIQQNTALSVVDHARKVAAVDIMPTGLVSNNVAVRGFNNIFSGASMFLVDNRLASVPSLRVNAFQLVPTTSMDIRSMEIVRGPASALYGPFASNGVIALYTKSPLDMENRMELTIGVTTGVRAPDDDMTAYGFKADNSVEKLGIFSPEIRIAGKLCKNLGVKFSGNVLRATDFAFFDPREPNGRVAQFGNQAAGAIWASDGSAPAVFNRDFGIKKISGETRIDWRPAPQTELIFSGGYSSNTNLELTGLGAAQAIGWTTNYGQIQFKKDRFYAQYYINATNSGNTYLIPQNPNQTTFSYLRETSNLQSIQLQHSTKTSDNKLLLVYGYDMFMTRPSGNVYGRFDQKANINQYGGYLQGDYKLNKHWSTTLAARADYQDAINEWMFSPRAAIVYKPQDNHSLRITYNRSFASPTSLNFFLDLNNGLLPTGQNLRAFGNATGMRYSMGTDGLPSLTLPNGTAMNYSTYMNGNIGLLNAKQALSQALVGKVPNSYIAPTVGLLFAGINPNVVLRDIVNGQNMDVNNISAVQTVKSTVTQTAEIGYKGLIMDKLSIGIDFYYTRINDFVSPLTVSTYNAVFDPAYIAASSTKAQMLSNINSPFLPPSDRKLVQLLLYSFNPAYDPKNANPTTEEVLTGYANLIGNLGTVSGGVVAPANTSTGRDILLTYVNLGVVDVAGTDLSFSYAATKDLNIEGAFSLVNKNKIPLVGAAGGFVSLNAPQYKSALNISYKMPIDDNGVTLSAGWRWMDQFDANSGVYIGRVNAMNMFDLGLSWRPSTTRNTVFTLNFNNLLDHRHPFFPLTSAMGRVILFKVQHTFGVK